jgi:hypothetical protein
MLIDISHKYIFFLKTLSNLENKPYGFLGNKLSRTAITNDNLSYDIINPQMTSEGTEVAGTFNTVFLYFTFLVSG